MVGQTLVLVASAAVLALCLAPRGQFESMVSRVLSRPWICAAGKYSYAMYVFHFPIHHTLSPYFTNWVEGGPDGTRIVRVLLYLALVSGLTVAASLLSWRVLERPMLALKDRIAPRVA